MVAEQTHRLSPTEDLALDDSGPETSQDVDGYEPAEVPASGVGDTSESVTQYELPPNEQVV